MSRGKCAIKFENMGVKVRGLWRRFRIGGMGIFFTGSPSFVLALKLKASKEDLNFEVVEQAGIWGSYLQEKAFVN